MKENIRKLSAVNELTTYFHSEITHKFINNNKNSALRMYCLSHVNMPCLSRKIRLNIELAMKNNSLMN